MNEFFTMKKPKRNEAHEVDADGNILRKVVYVGDRRLPASVIKDRIPPGLQKAKWDRKEKKWKDNRPTSKGS